MNHVDELISASLSGELSESERHRLESHLESCPRCRATLAAFGDQRRLVAGLRHVPAPRDLGAQVRSGIESRRRTGLPWWRRPTSLLAAVGGVGAVAAGAALAIVLFNSGAPQVASSVAPLASGSLSATPIPSESLTPTPTQTPAPTPTPSASVVPATTQPAGHFVYQVADQSGSVHFVTPDRDIILKLPSLGMPSRAALSPDGAWVAFRIDGESSGLSQYYVLHLADGKLTSLGESLMPSYGLGEQLSWDSSSFLAYTLTTTDTKSDVWVFSTEDQQSRQLTNTGDAFAGGWMQYQGPPQLWVSRVAPHPTSYLVPIVGVQTPYDPAAVGARQTAPGTFEPLVSPDGNHVIFWRGTMGTPGGHWSFSEGAMPWLAEVTNDGVDFANARQVFSTLAGGREMFRGASVTWGPDSDAFAVWNAQWTGVPQGDRFPDSTRVYFGHVSNAELITAGQTLDQADTMGATTITDVAIAADGNHLALTIVTAEGSEGGTYGPTAQLRLVTRGYGTDPDQIQTIGQDKVWYGPAVYAGIGQP